MSQIPLGIYKHYKGPHYLVTGVAHDANVEERLVVTYVALQGFEGDHDGPPAAVRTLVSFDQDTDAFMDWVHPDNGIKCVHGYRAAPLALNVTLCDESGSRVVPRFAYVGLHREEADL